MFLSFLYYSYHTKYHIQIYIRKYDIFLIIATKSKRKQTFFFFFLGVKRRWVLFCVTHERDFRIEVFPNNYTRRATY